MDTYPQYTGCHQTEESENTNKINLMFFLQFKIQFNFYRDGCIYNYLDHKCVCGWFYSFGHISFQLIFTQRCIS